MAGPQAGPAQAGGGGPRGAPPRPQACPGLTGWSLLQPDRQPRASGRAAATEDRGVRILRPGLRERGTTVTAARGQTRFTSRLSVHARNHDFDRSTQKNSSESRAVVRIAYWNTVNVATSRPERIALNVTALTRMPIRTSGYFSRSLHARHSPSVEQCSSSEFARRAERFCR